VKNVKFGFKAPVAMTLAPWWQNLLPNFRLLHVLRDGRDIAFSANQGPVQKFYDAMYGKQQRERGELKAIRLWSDWNAGLREWAEKIVKQVAHRHLHIHTYTFTVPSNGFHSRSKSCAIYIENHSPDASYHSFPLL
jgi:hypothetical protein